MNHHNNKHTRLITVYALCLLGLFGCADTPVHKLLEEKGWSEGDAKSIENTLRQTNLFGQISLAALVLKQDNNPKNAFTKPSACIFNDSSTVPEQWGALVDEIEQQQVIDRALPLDSDQRKEALELLKSGKAKDDLENSLSDIVQVLSSLKSSGTQKLVTDLSNADHAKALVSAMKTDLQLRIENGLDRKHLFVNTLKVLNSGALGSIVSDTVKAFINKDNKTMRLAIIAYARLNGINITEDNLNTLESTLSKDNPDFYPLLAGALDTMKKEYGIQDLNNQLSEMKRRNQECRLSTT